jgi:hypothetical protein
MILSVPLMHGNVALAVKSLIRRFSLTELGTTICSSVERSLFIVNKGREILPAFSVGAVVFDVDPSR